jgi:uncharacterized protein (DUF362 family)
MKRIHSNKQGYDRRAFLRTAAMGTAALFLPWHVIAEEASSSSLVLVRGGTREEALTVSLEALGGLSRFSPEGKTVVVKPNIGWDRLPAQGANTDPELVGAIVKTFVSRKAKVEVFDSTCNAAQRCYRRSGIEDAAKQAGAKVSFVHEKRFREISLPEGKELKTWPIYKDYLKADLRVNVPILKHHSLAGLSMGLKNLMGVMGDPRPSIHRGFDQKLIDITAEILPELTILDARRVLRRNGPQGGNPDDVEVMNCLIAGFDPVAVDGEGARLFGTDPRSLPYLVEAEDRGLGSIDRPETFREIHL